MFKLTRSLPLFLTLMNNELPSSWSRIIFSEYANRLHFISGLISGRRIIELKSMLKLEELIDVLSISLYWNHIYGLFHAFEPLASLWVYHRDNTISTKRKTNLAFYWLHVSLLCYLTEHWNGKIVLLKRWSFGDPVNRSTLIGTISSNCYIFGFVMNICLPHDTWMTSSHLFSLQTVKSYSIKLKCYIYINRDRN